VAEDHVEAVEGQFDAGGGHERFLMRPVDLGLMAGGGLEAQRRVGLAARPGALDVAAHGLVGADEAVVALKVLMDARREQGRLAGQPLVDQGLERVELRGCAPAPVDRLLAGLDVTLDRAPVTAQEPGDLGVGVSLAVQGLGVHELLLAEHASPLGRRRGTQGDDFCGWAARPALTDTIRCSWSDIIECSSTSSSMGLSGAWVLLDWNWPRPVSVETVRPTTGCLEHVNRPGFSGGSFP
jgi:hypothetical protein